MNRDPTKRTASLLTTQLLILIVEMTLTSNRVMKTLNNCDGMREPDNLVRQHNFKLDLHAEPVNVGRGVGVE